MKKTLTTGLMIVLSAAVLSACGTDGALNAASLNGSDNAFSQLALQDNATASDQGKGFRNKMGGQMGAKKGGPQGDGKGIAFGFLADLNLTDAQKTEIQSIMEATKANSPERTAPGERPAAPDATAIQAVQDKISAAFVSDNFDADALHAELESLRPEAPGDRPDPAAMEWVRAQQTLDIWNVLSAEQKATATSKAADFVSKMEEMDANRPEHGPKGPEQQLAQFTEKLSLSSDQQATLTAAFEANRPAAPAKPDPQALITLLNSGAATAESIAALHTRPEKVEHNPLSALATLHNVLTPDQRQIFVDSGLLKQGKRGPGAPEGGPGAKPQMGQRPNREVQ